MTVGPLEGATSGVGDEINLLSGIRSTRITVVTAPLSSPDAGTNNASTVNGVGITFPPLTIDTLTVLPGMLFRVHNGAFVVDSGTRARRAGIDSNNPASIEEEARAQAPELLRRVEILSDPLFDESGLTGFGDASDVGLRETTRGFAVEIVATLLTAVITTNRDVFVPKHVGGRIVMYGATIPGNLGTFEVTDVIDARTAEITRIGGAFVNETGIFAFEIEGVRQGDTLVVAGPGVSETIAAFGRNRARVDLLEDVLFFEEEDWLVQSMSRWAVITSVTPASVTLGGRGLGSNALAVVFASLSWEVIDPADLEIQVETTLGWRPQGTAFIDGVRYLYDDTTLTSLRGVQHFTDLEFVLGVKQQHYPIREVIDFTRVYSELDDIRRSFLIAYAEKEGLDAIGDRLSLSRPPLINDDTYRAALLAIGYGPRGTEFVLERFLDAVLGPDAYVIFEDLTSGSFNHPATVFFLRLGLAGVFIGKTFLDAEFSAPQITPIRVDVPDPPATLRVGGIRYADEPARHVPYLGRTHDGSRLVAYGPTVLGTASGALSGDGISVSFLGTSVGLTNVRKGDVFEIVGDSLPGFPKVSGTRPTRLFGTRGTINDPALLPVSLVMGVLPGAAMFEWPEDVHGVGPNLTVLSVTNLTRFTLGSGEFGPLVLPGDTLRITLAGTVYTFVIASIETDRKTLITLSPFPLMLFVELLYFPFEIVATGTRAPFINVPWKIWRPVSNSRFYFPNDDYSIEHAADTTGSLMWGLLGSFLDALQVPSTPVGAYLVIFEAALAAGRTVYEHFLRVLPGGRISFEFTIGTALGTLRVLDEDQLGALVYDGLKAYGIGLTLGPGPSPSYAQVQLRNRSATGPGEFFFHRRATGNITFAAGASDGELFLVTDARGKKVIFELDDIGSPGTLFPGAGYVLVVATLSSAISVADGFRTALDATQAAGRLDIVRTTADVFGTPQVFLEQQWPGVSGNGTGLVPLINSPQFTIVDFSGGSGVLANQGRLVGDEFKTYRLEKDPDDIGDPEIRLFENGVLVDLVRHDSAFGVVTASPKIEFGALNSAGGVPAALRVKQVDLATATPYNLWNLQRKTLGTVAPDQITTGFVATFVAGDVDRRIRVHETTARNAAWGSAVGEWVVRAVLGTTSVRVVGPINRRASFSLADRKRIVLKGGDFVTWPHNLGFSIEIDPRGLGHPNKGVYQITEIGLDGLPGRPPVPPLPGSVTLYHRLALAPSTPSQEPIEPQRSQIIKVDTSSLLPQGEFDGETAEAEWRLIPNFPTDSSGLSFDLVDVGAEALGVLTVARQPFPILPGAYTQPALVWTPLLSVLRTLVLSAQTLDPRAQNLQPFASPPVTDETFYPFYLWDAWGWIRFWLDKALLAAGVQADFDRLIKDDRGYHILDRLNPP